MTLHEIMGLSGRELDAAVAESLMGLRVVDRDWPCGREPECGCYEAALCREDEDAGDGWWTDRGPVYAERDGGWPPEPFDRFNGTVVMAAIVQPVPFYSSDASEADAVAKRVLSRGEWAQDLFFSALWLQAGAPAYRQADELCRARPSISLQEAEDGLTRLILELDCTLPQAICRAALWAASDPQWAQEGC